jgi:hypothetical protein
MCMPDGTDKWRSDVQEDSQTGQDAPLVVIRWRPRLREALSRSLGFSMPLHHQSSLQRRSDREEY